MLELLSRLYERDASSGDYRRPLVFALMLIAASATVLVSLSHLPFHEVHVEQGVIEPGQLELVRSEAAGVIRQNLLRMGETYEPGAPVLTLATAAGPERVYTAPCRCVIARSELLHRSAGEVRADELIGEFIDTTHPKVRFSVEGRWRESLAPGGKVHVQDEAGRMLEGSVEQIYPRRDAQLGLEALASVPPGAALSPGSPVTVRFEATPVPLWHFFINSLGK